MGCVGQLNQLRLDHCIMCKAGLDVVHKSVTVQTWLRMQCIAGWIATRGSM